MTARLFGSDLKRWTSLSDEERNGTVGEYFALTSEMRENRVYVAGAPLEPTSTSSTVRVRDDELLVTDGPFAETKEQLGGYFLIDVDTIDDAREWAGKVPAARYGSIEVRPALPVGAEAPTG